MWLRNRGVSSPSSVENRFLPVSFSTTLWWTCMALPGSPCMGFAMNVA